MVRHRARSLTCWLWIDSNYQVVPRRGGDANQWRRMRMGVGAVRIGVGFECDSLAVLHATAWRTTMRTCGGVDANSQYGPRPQKPRKQNNGNLGGGRRNRRVRSSAEEGLVCLAYADCMAMVALCAISILFILSYSSQLSSLRFVELEWL